MSFSPGAKNPIQPREEPGVDDWKNSELRWTLPRPDHVVDVHPRVHAIDDVNNATSEWVSVHIGEHEENSIEFVYDLELAGEGTRGYFIRLDSWKVKQTIIAE